MIRVAAGVEYELIYKKVKNLNLRISTGGIVRVSASKRVSVGEIDRFVASRAQWIAAARERMIKREMLEQPQDSYTDAECIAAFTAVFDRIYPLFADFVPEKPKLRVRWMKSRWGVCHLKGHYITLNKQLMDKPFEALEYVVLHEFVHFLHPNHQAGFHAEMNRLMPDYKERRKLLK